MGLPVCRVQMRPKGVVEMCRAVVCKQLDGFGNEFVDSTVGTMTKKYVKSTSELNRWEQRYRL